ncbi:MAG: glycosyltransferase [Eubacteriaceae bacterium]|nr:glycosyltransferase [Eubacteriaceae bacterium]
MKPIIIIPALNPDKRLVYLAENLKKEGFEIVVVNDGSADEYKYIFKKLETDLSCAVCTHEHNEGKGTAIKTGIQYAYDNYSDISGYVTADADGQHDVSDIIKVSNSLINHPESFILGTRDFSEKNIPVRSRFGNRLTSLVFLLSTGKQCKDTQTGLRGIPAVYTDLCLSIPGKRYEYEMNLLMEITNNKIDIKNIPISVIYTDNNSSSHFNAVRDSLLIYLNIIKYSISSVLSAVTDLSMFVFLAHLAFGTTTSGIFFSTVIARVTSGNINFMLNKYWVFKSKNYIGKEFAKYITLFLIQMLSSWALVSLLSIISMPILLIKIFVDTMLFFISYVIQKKYIFSGIKKYAKN